MASILTSESHNSPLTVAADSPDEQITALDEAMIMPLFREHGAILIRGFRLDTASFRIFAEQFCSGAVLNDAAGRRLIDSDNNIQSVNLGIKPFPLHPELSVVPWKPDVCFFACFSPPTRGGETLICDGCAIVEAMPAPVYDAFASRRLLYAKSVPLDEIKFWLGTTEPDDALLEHPPASCPFEFRRRDGRIERVFTAPALHRPMFTDRLAFGNFLLFARYMLKRKDFPTFDDAELVPDKLVDEVRAIGDDLAMQIRWQVNDVIMIDNTRFMHGRNAIVDQQNRLIASYFGYLKTALPGAEEPADAPWRAPGFSGFERAPEQRSQR